MSEKEHTSMSTTQHDGGDQQHGKASPHVAVEQVTADEAGTQPHSAKTRHRFMLWMGILLGVLIMACVAAVYLLVYRSANDSSAARWLKKNVPLPAAVVGTDIVWVSELQTSVDAANYFFDKQDELGLDLVGRPATSDLQAAELDRLITKAIVFRVANSRGVSVDSVDIDKYFTNQILPQAPGGIAEVEQTVQDLYGWSVAEFKQNILEEVVLRQQVDENIQADASVDAEAKQTAQDVYQHIQEQTEKPFSDFATEYSDDPGSAANGGMLGFFGKGAMVPEFEEVAFSLDIGEVSEPVRTVYGYHIIKVTNKDEAAETVEARHILIAFQNVDDMITSEREQVRIWNLLPAEAL